MQFWAIIPAAGIGKRMGMEIPKQYLNIAQKPIIQYTLESFLTHPKIKGVVLALAPQDPYWSKYADNIACHHKPLLTVDGGDERCDSVLAALKHLNHQQKHEDCWVMVHDAARPCLSHKDIDKLISTIDKNDCDGALLGVPIVDTVKLCENNNIVAKTVPRDGLWRAQTPQCFRLQHLIEALEKSQQLAIAVTDESSAMEAIDAKILMVQGNADNIKLTLPEDVAHIERILNCQAEQE